VHAKPHEIVVLIQKLKGHQSITGGVGDLFALIYLHDIERGINHNFKILIAKMKFLL